MLEKLILFVEEYSMEVMLEGLLPHLIPDTEFQIIRFQCKDDLLKNLQDRLRGYAQWLPEHWGLLVIVDRDDDDCANLKQRLEMSAANAGLRSKSSVNEGESFQIVNRIAIEELEAWYFGDWTAVRNAFPRVAEGTPRNQRYREPDAIRGGTWEALERVMQKAGYFRTGLRKVECARKIGPMMQPEENQSPSFQAFVGAVHALQISC